MSEDLSPELALIGIAMHAPTVIDDVEVTHGDFAHPRAGAVWRLMTELHAANEPTDPTTILANQGRLEVRGVEAVWLSDLWGAAPIPELADHYARLIVEAATLRRLDATATRIRQLVHDQAPAAETIEIARAEIDACTRTSAADVTLIGDRLDETLVRLEEPGQFTPTPWADLNYLIGGFRPGCMYVVGARPGVGKTLLGLQAALHLTEFGLVGLHTLEMSHYEVNQRVISQTARVPMGRLMSGELNEGDWDAITRHAAEIGAMPFSVDDRSAVTPLEIRAHMRSLARRGPVAGLVVDYLQLMTAPPGDRRPRQEVVAQFSRDLKILAKDFQVPVLALSQLNRGSEARMDKKPTMADLRESGGLEQDADVVILLHVDKDDPSTLYVIVEKNRHGQTGEFKLARRGQYARLDNYQWTPEGARS